MSEGQPLPSFRIVAFLRFSFVPGMIVGAAGAIAILAMIALAAATASAQQRGAAAQPATPARPAAAPVLIRNATVLTASRGTLENTDIVLRGGKIAAIGANLAAPAGGRTYLTGGMGSHHTGEAFGDDFVLPPDRAYSETCAGIASVTNRMCSDCAVRSSARVREQHR